MAQRNSGGRRLYAPAERRLPPSGVSRRRPARQAVHSRRVRVPRLFPKPPAPQAGTLPADQVSAAGGAWSTGWAPLPDLPAASLAAVPALRFHPGSRPVRVGFRLAGQQRCRCARSDQRPPRADQEPLPVRQTDRRGSGLRHCFSSAVRVPRDVFLAGDRRRCKPRRVERHEPVGAVQHRMPHRVECRPCRSMAVAGQ